MKRAAEPTKRQLIEAILADMARYRPRADAEKEHGGFLRGLRKNELEDILATRLDGTKKNRESGLL